MADEKLPAEPTPPGKSLTLTRKSMKRSSLYVKAGGFQGSFFRSDGSFNSEDGSDDEEPETKVVFTEVEEAFAAIKAGLKEEAYVEDLRRRVARAVGRANEAAQTGQHGLSDELLDTAAGWVLEQQAAAFGVTKWVPEQLVRRVLTETERGHKLTLIPLESFPRILPNVVHEKIRLLKSIFTSFHIVFTNPQNHQLKKKDPILFGRIGPFGDRLYYITDWIDEYCDLTMEKFVAIAEDGLHADWKVNEIPHEPTDEDLAALVGRLHNSRGGLIRYKQNVIGLMIGRFIGWLTSLPLWAKEDDGDDWKGRR